MVYTDFDRRSFSSDSSEGDNQALEIDSLQVLLRALISRNQII